MRMGYVLWCVTLPGSSSQEKTGKRSLQTLSNSWRSTKDLHWIEVHYQKKTKPETSFQNRVNPHAWYRWNDPPSPSPLHTWSPPRSTLGGWWWWTRVWRDWPGRDSSIWSGRGRVLSVQGGWQRCISPQRPRVSCTQTSPSSSEISDSSI